MGPGYFPLVLGGLLVLLGLAIVAEGYVRGREAPIGPIPWRGADLPDSGRAGVWSFRAAAWIGASSFPYRAPRRAFSSERTSLLAALAMAAGLTIVCVLIFVEGLGMPVPLLGPWLRF